MILHFLNLIRVKNLLIIVATQYMMRWLIINPILQVNSFDLQFSELDFAFLVLSTVLLSAAGYVINDYFDTKTDSLNRPDTVVVGKYISRRSAIIVHIVFNVIAIILGFYISYKIHLWKLGAIFVIITGILWYYSSTYKRQFLIGNIIVALLTAMVPLMVVLYEIPLLNIEFKDTLLKYHINFNNLFFWVSGFSFFAFLSTLIREIVKDIEDFEGDQAYGRNTLPIVLGLKTTKTIVVSLIAITIAAMVGVYSAFLNDTISLVYLIVALILPFLFLAYKIIRASKKSDYHMANILSKIIMLAGLLYSFVVYYVFTYQFSA